MDILAGFVIALTLGGMTFFSFVFSPLAIVKLPAETAGPFIRQVFPWYFLLTAVLFALAVPLMLSAPGLAALMAAMAGLGLANRQLLMPRINALRDRQIARDPQAGAAFDWLHRGSVAINFVQRAAAGWAPYMVLA